MGCEPDEMQQMVHMLMCSNEFELEGLIAVTGKWIHPEMKDKYKRVTHPELFTKLIEAYAKIYPNLQKHATGWHTPEYLQSIVSSGQSGYGINDVGEGKSSEGSKLIEKAFNKIDSRPIWIAVNAGSNTLAQALYDYKKTHNHKELNKLISKLRIFENGAQDNAGAYLCKKYPNIHWIRSNYQTYAYGGPGKNYGIGPQFWDNYDYSTKGQNDWLIENIMKNHGDLGALYPERNFGEKFGFMEGGGTIPWIGLVNKGLFNINQPSWGGWGGRYSFNKVLNIWSRHKSVSVDEAKYVPFYTYSDTNDTWYNKKDSTFYKSNFSPIWRWRQAMYNDFKCRMDWSIQAYENANHHPKAAFFNDISDNILFITARPDEIIKLDASQSTDPDGNKLEYEWWVYKEAGTYNEDISINNSFEKTTEIKIPLKAAKKEIHLILEIKDTHPIAPLYDYRRIVIKVNN